MATSTKSKRRVSGSKGKIKHTRAKRLLSRNSGTETGEGRVKAHGRFVPPPARVLDPHPAYTRALDFLMSHTDYEKMRVVRYNTTTFSLDRMRTLLKHLGNPHTKFKTAHVAGTKGKGSTCHMLAAMLQSGGLKTGLYASPHIVDMRERIRINGDLISHDDIVGLVKRVEPALRKTIASGVGRPTFFEIF